MGKLGLTPIIGLAVVVALALAAVFGAMSLTNPAFAQATPTPTLEDSGCVANGFIPDQAVALGAAEAYSVTNCFAGDPTQARSDNEDVATVTLGDTGDLDNRVIVTGKALGTANIEVAHASGAKSFDVTVYDTPVGIKGSISSVSIGDPGATTDGAEPTSVKLVDVADYFTGEDAEFEFESGDDTKVTATQPANVTIGTDTTVVGEGSSKVVLTAIDGQSGNVTITVSASNSINESDVEQEFTVYIDTAPRALPLDGDDATTTEIIEASMDQLDLDASREVDVSLFFAGNRNEYVSMSSDDNIVTVDPDNGEGPVVTITGEGVGNATLTVTASNGGGSAEIQFDVPVRRGEIVVPPMTVEANLEADSNDPGDNTKYTFQFNADQRYIPGVDDIVIEFNEDFSVPSSIAESSVTIQVGSEAHVTNPAVVLVDGEEITLELGDLDGDDDNSLGMIAMGEVIKVIFKPSAGISNPTEGKSYDEIKVQGTDLDDEFPVYNKISLDPEDGGRNETVTVTGKGFKNGTTVTFVLLSDATSDTDVGAALFDDAEPLCSGEANGDDVASCEFTVTSPLFVKDENYVNAVDGKSATAPKSKPFVLEPSISASPASGSPGDSIQVQMYDFDPQATVTGVQIARRYLCMMSGEPNTLATKCSDGYTNVQPNAGVSNMGEGTFRMVIPNGAPIGKQELRVVTSGGDDTTNIIISGPRVTVTSPTPGQVLANQRLSVAGNGFTSNSRVERITFAGEEIESWTDNNGPRVDNGGNFTLSLDLPITNSTTSAGDHAIVVTDTEGREGGVGITVPERVVSITPDTGRVGTIAVVRGENFPSKNDDGRNVNLSISYEAQNGKISTSAIPNASGAFEAQITIPTTATIPSTNLVTVSFNTGVGGDLGAPVTIQVNHNVPEATISLSETSGGPGSVIAVSGDGFKAFVPVTTVEIGSLEVTPSPKPKTDANGMVEFDITIPGLDTGVQTVEVNVSGTTAGAGFNVSDSGVVRGAIKPVAEALTPLADSLEVVWHFNNDTKTWTFYDGEEGSDLTHMISGETYSIQVKSTVTAILNNLTKTLSCNEDSSNCWNTIVW